MERIPKRISLRYDVIEVSPFAGRSAFLDAYSVTAVSEQGSAKLQDAEEAVNSVGPFGVIEYQISLGCGREMWFVILSLRDSND